MDMKSKGKTWVGNIYRKFEVMCQDVDDFVRKDTVKYVENQAQTVGGSVKKFYSGVVQDFLPSVMDPLKQEADAVTTKSNYVITTYYGAIAGTSGVVLCDHEKEISMMREPLDTVKSCNKSCELDKEPSLMPPTSADSCEAAVTSLSVETGDIAICESSDVGVKKNVMVEEQQLAEDGSAESCDKAKKHETISSSGEDGDFESCNGSDISIEEYVKGKEQHVAEYSSTGSNKEAKTSLSVGEKGFVVKIKSELHDKQSVGMVSTANYSGSTETSSSFGQYVAAARCNSADVIIKESLKWEDKAISEYLTSSACFNLAKFSSPDEDLKSITKHSISATDAVSDFDLMASQEAVRYFGFPDEAKCISNFPSSIQSVDCVLSDHFSRNEETEAEEALQFSSLSRERICCCHTELVGFSPETSSGIAASASTPDLPCNSKIVDRIPDSPSNSLTVESSGILSCHDGLPVSMVGSTGDTHGGRSLNTELMDLLSSAQTGSAADSFLHDAYANMETIDLSDNRKLEKGCVTVNCGRLPYAAFTRSGSLRYYKKLIQGAFASRKRLTKEYEQLAIWFGDIDLECEQPAVQSLSPSTPAFSLHSEKSPTCNILESGWEFV